MPRKLSQDEIAQKLLKNTSVLLNIVILRHQLTSMFKHAEPQAITDFFPGHTNSMRIKGSYYLKVR